jgi:hypothetical protein
MSGKAAYGVRLAAYGMWCVIMQVESRKTGRNPESGATRDHASIKCLEVLTSRFAGLSFKSIKPKELVLFIKSFINSEKEQLIRN